MSNESIDSISVSDFKHLVAVHSRDPVATQFTHAGKTYILTAKYIICMTTRNKVAAMRRRDGQMVYSPADLSEIEGLRVSQKLLAGIVAIQTPCEPSVSTAVAPQPTSSLSTVSSAATSTFATKQLFVQAAMIGVVAVVLFIIGLYAVNTLNANMNNTAANVAEGFKMMQAMHATQLKHDGEIGKVKEHVVENKAHIEQVKGHLGNTDGNVRVMNEHLVQAKEKLDQTKEELNQTKEELDQTKHELNQTNEYVKYVDQRLGTMEYIFQFFLNESKNNQSTARAIGEDVPDTNKPVRIVNNKPARVVKVKNNTLTVWSPPPSETKSIWSTIFTAICTVAAVAFGWGVLQNCMYGLSPSTW